MRRLIATILTLSVAFASMAWAADLHAEALTGQHVGLEQAHHNIGNAEAPCDHCCHGDAHHSALCESHRSTLRLSRDALRPPLIIQLASHSKIPPTPPPDI